MIPTFSYLYNFLFVKQPFHSVHCGGVFLFLLYPNAQIIKSSILLAIFHFFTSLMLDILFCNRAIIFSRQ